MALSGMQKAGWGLADMGINVFVVVKQLLVFTFLTTFQGVPVGVAGWVTFAVLAFDVVTDPLVGYLSDRTQSRWGRRAPWIFVGAVLLALGIVGIFAVPEGMDWRANMMWVIGFFGAATIGFTFVAIPYGAQAGEMTEDARERSAMTAFRMGFASLGLLLAGGVVPALAGNTREGYLSAVLTIAPVVVLTIWASLWFTRKAPRITQPATGNFRQMLKLVLGNRSFVILVVIYGVLTLGVAIIAAGLQLAALYLIGTVTEGIIGGLVGALGMFSVLFTAFIIGSILSQYLWVRISARWGKLGALGLGIGLYVLVLLAIYMQLPATSFAPIAALFLAAGLTNGAYQQVPWAMYPDLMDITRRESGEAIEGAFSAFWLFGQKVANAFAPLVLGTVLAVYGWRESTQGVIEQPQEALEALRMALTLLPAALLGIGLASLCFFYRPSLPPDVHR